MVTGLDQQRRKQCGEIFHHARGRVGGVITVPGKRICYNMSEVLSQSQIDMLLNAARNGNIDAGVGNTAQSGRKAVSKYDFYSPKKFTRDRLKMK